MTNIATLIFLTCTLACNSKKEKPVKSIDLTVQKATNDTISEQEIKVIEAVLNLQNVIKFSKTDYIIEKYKKLYIKVDGRIFKNKTAIINQKKHTLTLLDKLDTLDRSTTPCYIFTKINIDKDTAYVQMFFEMTGTLAYGKMIFSNNQWVPSRLFLLEGCKISAI